MATVTELSRSRGSSIDLGDKFLMPKDLDKNVGFSDLPNQIHRKTIKKGFEFSLMVVGKILFRSFFMSIANVSVKRCRSFIGDPL